MAERLGFPARPISMRKVLLGLVLAMPLALAACGDDTAGVASSGTPATSSTGAGSCRERSDGPQASVAADLDGDGSLEEVSYWPPGHACPGKASLAAKVGSDVVRADLPGDLPVNAGDLGTVRIPGRQGDLVLVTAQHPRGGFQASLFGFSGGKLAQLTVGGQPILPFVATDVTSTPLAATCTSGGFEVTEARAHQPIGVVPAWDLYRTTYTVAGDAVSKAATTELADNVLDKQLRAKYRSLVGYSLFENCRGARNGRVAG